MILLQSCCFYRESCGNGLLAVLRFWQTNQRSWLRGGAEEGKDQTEECSADKHGVEAGGGCLAVSAVWYLTLSIQT